MAAPILRTRSTLLSSAPPPSPIATAKGIRPAAINDSILSEFLHESLKIPDLTLPPSYFGRIAPRIPAEIDLTSLTNDDEDCVRQLLDSAAGLGAFQILGHQLSVSQIGKAIEGSDQVFRGVPKWKKLEMNRRFGRGNDVREDLLWFGAGREMEKGVAEDIGAETFRMLSENMSKLFGELEAVAEVVGGVVSKHARKREGGSKMIEEQESVLCIHKYSGNDTQDGNPPVDGQVEIDLDSSRHAFHLHLSDHDLEFRVRSKKGSFSFSASAGAIVVTVGEQLQEWSDGEFKFSVAEPIFDFGIDAKPYFSLQFNSSPSSLNYGLNHSPKKLSLVDQMLIMLAVAFLYSLFAFISTKLLWAKVVT